MAHNRESNTELISRMDTKRRCRGGGRAWHTQNLESIRIGQGGVGWDCTGSNWTGQGMVEG